jgi:hypothetical protein
VCSRRRECVGHDERNRAAEPALHQTAADAILKRLSVNAGRYDLPPRYEGYSCSTFPILHPISSLNRMGLAQREARNDLVSRGGNEACYQIEESSFWFKHRNACIEAAVKCHPPRSGGPIFDVGGGNGFVARGLMRAGFETVFLNLLLSGEVMNVGARRRMIFGGSCLLVASAA